MNLHPGAAVALQRLCADELGIARMMVAGELSSPQRYENVTLFAMRITGTGLAYRKKLKEHVWRDPSVYLNEDFLARCNGLPVVWEHPHNSVLDSEQFGARVIGTVFLPFVEGDEVWCISKIFDQQAAQMMEEGKLSTSPAVVFRDPAVNEKLLSGDGRSLLLEGKPSLMDHLAVVALGVWDKSGKPAGVRNDEDNSMVKRADGTEDGGDKLDKVLAHLDSITRSCGELSKRMDEMEAKGKLEQDDDDAEGGDMLPPEAPKPLAADAQSRRDAKRDAEENAMTDAQAKADGAYHNFGKRAPPPMAGERVMAYRVRLLKDLKRFSPAYKAANLRAVADADASAFDAIEAQIFADATEAAKCPDVPEFEGLRAITKTDPETGFRRTEFYGKHTFVKLMSPPRRYVTRFNTVAGDGASH